MILHEFLQDSENDFTGALGKTVEQISSTKLLDRRENRFMLFQQNKNEYNHYETSSHYFNEYTTVQTSTNGTKGKEKGVFSKKQLLIFFDLLSESKAIDKIDYSKPNKFESIALMLQAVSGKSKDSIMEQLKDTRNNGLYSFQNQGELNQLIITLTNLAETFRKAGYRTVATVADRKIRELERMKYR